MDMKSCACGACTPLESNRHLEWSRRSPPQAPSRSPATPSNETLFQYPLCANQVPSYLLDDGELEGIAYWSWSALRSSHQHWVRENKIHMLFHTGDRVHPEIPQVRLIRDLVTEPNDKRALDFILAREILGRPFLAPPDVPADRVKALRAACDATLKDKDFLVDAERRQAEINLVPGDEIDALLKTAAAAPKDVIERVKKALGQ